jgi:hypothetical protein
MDQRVTLSIAFASLLALPGVLSDLRATSPYREAVPPTLLGDAAQRSGTAVGPIAIDTSRYRLITTRTGFQLSQISDRSRKPFPIPRGWLIPPEEEEAESGAYVSSFNYGEKVISFEIGDGRVGIHMSSYGTQPEGSAQASAGRDVFLVLDPRRGQLRNPDLRLGVTRHRVRARGCFEASQSNFLLSDINSDGRLDLGVIKEEFVCREVTKGGVDTVEGPLYERHPVRWYVFAGDGWNLDETFDGRPPTGSHVELPATGAPVDSLKKMFGPRE